MKKVLYHLEYILIIPLIVMSIILGMQNDFIMYALSGGFLLCFSSYLLLVLNNQKCKIISGIIQFINGPFIIVILLLLATMRLSYLIPYYYIFYVIFYLAFKIFTFIYYRINDDDYLSVVYKENALMMIIYITDLFVCILFYRFHQNELLSFIFLIVKLAFIFVTSNFSAYYSASTLIIIGKQKKMRLKEKISAVTDFIFKYNLPFIFGEIFCITITITYLIRWNENENYKYLAAFYGLYFILRTMIFIWNYILNRKYKNDPYRLYRRKFILLIVVSGSFIFFNQTLNSILLAINDISNNPNAFPTWWLLLIILPFSGYSFVNSVLSYRKARKEDDAYFLAYSNISCISSMYMLFGSCIYVLSKFESNTYTTIVWYILLIAVVISQIIIVAISLIIGIKGISGHRKKPEDFRPIENVIEDDKE